MKGVVRVAVVLAAMAAWAADWNTAVALYKKGDFAAALREFQAVLEENPNYAGAYYYVGACQEKLGQKDQALANYQKASQMEPTNPVFAQGLARLLVDLGKPSEAVKVLQVVPTETLKGEQKAVLLTTLARAKLAANDVSGAVESARSATQAAANMADAWALLGTAQSRAGRDAEAFAAYRRAFELSGDANLGKTAATAGLRAARLVRGQDANALYAQAAAVAVKAYEKKPSFDLALLAAEAFLGGDRYDESLAWLDRAAVDNALTTYYRGQCAQGKGDVARAEKYFRDALTKNPDQHLRRLIYASLGFVLDKQKRYKDAEQAYQEAGNPAKAAEMRDKQAKYEQNLKADEEARRIEEIRKTQEELRRLRGGAPTPSPKT
ncbi:MAG: tetratricopeptide repeat protein [Thermoanaerobaculum sp.]|nr:tetratricopeptide repeat protein [Thermoanaerobaculum sp.]